MPQPRSSEKNQRPLESPWFVLDGVQTQGPLASADIHQRLQAGALPSHTLFWREGMPDWQSVAQVREFASFAGTLPVVASPEWQMALDFIEEPPATPQLLAQAQAPTLLTSEDVERFANGENLSTPEWPRYNSEHAWAAFQERQGLQPHLDEMAKIAAAESVFPKFQRRWTSRHWWMAAAAVSAVSALTTIAIAISSPRFRPLDDLTRDENRELAAAAAESLSAHGPGAAIAMSHRDPTTPEFVVATNLDDGTSLKIQIDGIPETLVGRFKVSVRAAMTVKSGLVRTPVFRQDGGLAYPPGDYRVSVWCLSCGKTRTKEPLAQKIYFQPGVKTPDYEKSRVAYHERLQVQAHDELNELKQVSDTLENQLDETSNEFRKKSAATDWPKFHARWSSLQDQLEALFARWTPESLDGGYFHAALYASLKHLGEQTRQLHLDQTEALAAAKTDADVVQKWIALSADYQTALRQFQLALQQTLALPAEANGLPARLPTNPETRP